jgi:thiamine biosynthesis lipoprotein
VVLIGVVRLWPGERKAATKVARPPAAAVCRDQTPPQAVDGGWFNDERTVYHEIPARVFFRLSAKGAENAAAICCKAWAEFERLGHIFNAFSPNSELGRLNRLAAAGCQPVSRDLFEVLAISRMLWAKSEGRFDPTVWPLKELWSSAVKSQRAPDRDAIASVLGHMGFDKVQFCKAPYTLRFSDARVKLDLGAIAKGYAVDRVRALLQAQGASSGLVQLGGEIACFGQANANKWRLGVQHPKEGADIWGTISARDYLRVSTSGNYRQPLEIGGQTYYHIFDPTTGLPAPNRVLGVTTADLDGRATSALLDGAATAITVLGAEKGLSFARQIGIDALVLAEEAPGVIVEQMTAGFRSAYTRNNEHSNME